MFRFRIFYLQDMSHENLINTLCLRICVKNYVAYNKPEQSSDFIYDLYFALIHFLQAKGYRVGPVYDDVLAMAWFFLELIVKSMALEQSHLFYHNLPLGTLY